MAALRGISRAVNNLGMERSPNLLQVLTANHAMA
jgi:hypothetical protein